MDGLLLASVVAADLDGDRYPEIARTTGAHTGITILPNRTAPPRAVDRDRESVLDECDRVEFRRGDWNQDGRLNLSDPVSLLNHLFRGREAPPPFESCGRDLTADALSCTRFAPCE